MRTHARIIWIVILLTVSSFSMKNCFAQNVFIIIRTTTEDEAQHTITNAFANGLQPEQRGTGQNTDDFLNFLAAPVTHPFFLIGFGNQTALLRLNQGDRLFTGVLFEVRPNDNNFWDLHAIFGALEVLTENTNDPFQRFLDTAARVYGLQVWEANHPLNRVIVVTGFNGTAIPAAAIRQATIFVAGTPRIAQLNQGFDQNGTNRFPPLPALAAPTRQVPQLVDTVVVQENNRWVTLLAALSCGLYRQPRVEDRQQMLSSKTCKLPSGTPINDVVAELRKELEWKYLQMLFFLKEEK